MLGTPPQPCGWPLPSGAGDCGKDHPLLPLRPCPPRRGGRAHRRDSEKSDRRTGQPLGVRDQQTSCCSPTAWFGANFITSLHLSVSNPKTRNGNYLYGCHEDKMLLLRDACAHKSTCLLLRMTTIITNVRSSTAHHQTVMVACSCQAVSDSL